MTTKIQQLTEQRLHLINQERATTAALSAYDAETKALTLSHREEIAALRLRLAEKSEALLQIEKARLSERQAIIAQQQSIAAELRLNKAQTSIAHAERDTTRAEVLFLVDELKPQLEATIADTEPGQELLRILRAREEKRQQREQELIAAE